MQSFTWILLRTPPKALKQWIHHSEEKVKKIIADVKAYPIRRFNLGTIVPGVIVPRVVGTIGEAGISIQEGFYAAVNTLFYKNGTLPTEYTLHSKLQVLVYYLHFVFLLTLYF